MWCVIEEVVPCSKCIGHGQLDCIGNKRQTTGLPSYNYVFIGPLTCSKEWLVVIGP